MNNINSNFRTLRVHLRKNGIEIAENVFRRFHPSTIVSGDEICIFCKSTLTLTKEHVLPKWLIQKEMESRMVSSVNRQTQSYKKIVVPTCSKCNNSILAEIEKHIIKILQKVEVGTADIDDVSNIIRWLEILEYKLQVYDCRRMYLKYADSDYDPFWGILPVSVMRHFIEMDAFKALEYLRRSQRRIAVKSKIDRVLSLVLFQTSKPHFNFFVQPDEYIYVSFPTQKIAMFYFLRKKFENYQKPYEEALYYIDGVFKS